MSSSKASQSVSVHSALTCKPRQLMWSLSSQHEPRDTRTLLKTVLTVHISVVWPEEVLVNDTSFTLTLCSHVPGKGPVSAHLTSFRLWCQAVQVPVSHYSPLPLTHTPSFRATDYHSLSVSFCVIQCLHETM